MIVADSVTHIVQHLQHQALNAISVAKVCNQKFTTYLYNLCPESRFYTDRFYIHCKHK